jgi:hypothetical protein
MAGAMLGTAREQQHRQTARRLSRCTQQQCRNQSSGGGERVATDMTRRPRTDRGETPLLPAEALLPGGGHNGGEALEPRGGTGDGDAAGVLEPYLLFRLPEQLPERGVVEVQHWHHVPHRLSRCRAAHVHRHLHLGGRAHRRLAVV